MLVYKVTRFWRPLRLIAETWNPWESWPWDPKCQQTERAGVAARASVVVWRLYPCSDWLFRSPPFSACPVVQAHPEYEKWNHSSLDWEDFSLDQDSKIRDGEGIWQWFSDFKCPQPPGRLVKYRCWTPPQSFQANLNLHTSSASRDWLCWPKDYTLIATGIVERIRNHRQSSSPDLY